MNPQGSQILNIDQIDNLIAQINAAPSCEELQVSVTACLTSLGSIKAIILAQIEAKALFLDLLTPPTANLTKIVTWITDFITAFIGPEVAAYYTYAAQLALLLEKIVELETAISNAQSRFDSCSIVIPVIP
jgi:hypothetical protein